MASSTDSFAASFAAKHKLDPAAVAEAVEHLVLKLGERATSDLLIKFGEGLRGELRGWEEISRAAACSEKTAREYARFGVEHRMPVFLDVFGRPIALASEIERWRLDGRRPFGAREYSRALPSNTVSSRIRRKNKAKRAR